MSVYSPPPPCNILTYIQFDSTQGCESICEKKSEKVWNAWKYVLFNTFKVWKWGFVKSKKVWNQIQVWTLTSMSAPVLTDSRTTPHRE